MRLIIIYGRVIKNRLLPLHCASIDLKSLVLNTHRLLSVQQHISMPSMSKEMIHQDQSQEH